MIGIGTVVPKWIVHVARDDREVGFNPQEDMTAQELAYMLPMFLETMNMRSHVFAAEKFILSYDNLPKKMKRHFWDSQESDLNG